MHYTFDGHKIDGFRPYDLARGIDDDRNSLVLLQIEDSLEIWETERMSDYGSREDSMRSLLNWMADCDYCDPSHVIRWIVLDMDVRHSRNRSHRQPC